MNNQLINRITSYYMLRNLILNLSITMNLFKASSLIFCNAANSISAFSLQSVSGLRNRIIPQLGLCSLKVNSPKSLSDVIMSRLFKRAYSIISESVAPFIISLTARISTLFSLKMEIIGYSIFSSAKYLIRMPMVLLFHFLTTRLRKPCRQTGHPLSDQDSFGLFPETFDHWTSFQVVVLQISGYPLSQVCHIGYSDWSRYCHSSFSSQLLFLQKYGKRVVSQNRFIWIAISFVIATPIAYYAMNKWLENFAYKTDLSWWIFALAGMLALGIALLTVSWQSWRAATRNPVEALRYE